MVLLYTVSCVVTINNGHIGHRCLRNLKRKANEATNNFSGTAAGVGNSVCVNRLRPVEAVGGGMKDEALHRAQSAIDYTILALSNGNDLTYAKACLESALTAIKQARAAPVQPVATLWQHGETGRTRITMPGDITDCDARWFKAADLYTTPPAQPAPDYAWPTVADYEKDVGFEVNEAFKMAWAMARTTNALFT
jgi:hypothetical protein